MTPLFLVFVHGYSVTNTDTYGELPLRLRNEALARGIDAKIENIYLGRYISFNDEVRLDDVSRAMQAAVDQQIPKGARFVCITHSTGGPVVRNWWHLFYENGKQLCPMSHLVMLAPANHGSALAQLGKTRISRVKSWFDGVEPGQKILDWLELGSAEAWNLNLDWIRNGGRHLSEKGIFPFVLTGQDIDRKLYDHINSYTGELGSDGVVRVASANLNSSYILLKQNGDQLEPAEFIPAPRSAMRVVSRKSHSGETMGIMRSVLKEPSDTNSSELVNAFFECISVNNVQDYARVCELFDAQTAEVQRNSRVERDKKLLKTTVYFHDRYCMVMIRVKDSQGYPVNNFDLLLTGPGNDPDMLPSGFFADRQSNKLNNNTLTYYFNYDAMAGSEPIMGEGGELRKRFPGIDSLGLQVRPRPDEGFIRYQPCFINAGKDLFQKAIRPNATTLIDIELKRIVSTEVFRFEKADPKGITKKSFKNTEPGSGTLDQIFPG